MEHTEYLKRLFNHIESKGYTIECECEGEEENFFQGCAIDFC